MKRKIIFGFVSLFLGVILFVFGFLGKDFIFADSAIFNMSFFAFGFTVVIGVALISMSILLFAFAIFLGAKKP